MHHALFGAYAHRYDLHTPPGHYQHDHRFVLDVAAEVGQGARILDVGCGTGVLVAKAIAEGFEAQGIDASPDMVRAAQKRAGPTALRVLRMEDLAETESYDVVVSLSWSLNYCDGFASLRDVLARLYAALRSGGRLVLQVAHAPHVDGLPFEDTEAGPTGEPDDISLRCCFEALGAEDLRARYEFECRSTGERLVEEHVLHVADARRVAEDVGAAGFEDVKLYDSWRRDAFGTSASPFVCARKP